MTRSIEQASRQKEVRKSDSYEAIVADAIRATRPSYRRFSTKTRWESDIVARIADTTLSVGYREPWIDTKYLGHLPLEEIRMQYGLFIDDSDKPLRKPDKIARGLNEFTRYATAPILFGLAETFGNVPPEIIERAEKMSAVSMLEDGFLYLPHGESKKMVKFHVGKTDLAGFTIEDVHDVQAILDNEGIRKFFNSVEVSSQAVVIERVDYNLVEVRTPNGNSWLVPLEEPHVAVEQARSREIIRDEDRLIPLDYEVTHSTIKQIKAHKEAPSRYPVDVSLSPGATWEEIDLSSYHPQEYTSQDVIEGNYAGDKPSDRKNPLGPTGRTGRGDLWKWEDETVAGDAIVTQESSEQKMQLLLVLRSKVKKWAIPGGMKNAGESTWQTAARELREETHAVVDLKNATEVFSRAVDDPRNTDDAWITATAYHRHLPPEAQLTLRANPGETDAAMFVTLTKEVHSSLFASQPHEVSLAIIDWQKKTGLVVAKDGVIGLPAPRNPEK